MTGHNFDAASAAAAGVESNQSSAELLRVLHIEDAPAHARIIERTMREGGFNPTVVRVETAIEMQSVLADQSFDVVLSDHDLPEFNAVSAMAMLRQAGCRAPLILVAGSITDQFAEAARAAGAVDCVSKSNIEMLVPAIRRALGEDAEDREPAVRHG